ncbi:hypothetical protein ACFQ07_29735 [Actinomadura adrarensis]|uniref:Uncharacterized protein n=1 Tax=Actinomadura adrarensis TaxID=1819600 RepID=A0ABW3CSB0_9ACTN
MVQYPEMRAQILETLRALADPEHQRQVWVEHRPPRPGYYDDLDLNISVLFDDTIIAEDPCAHIGKTLHNENEAQAVQALVDVLDPFIESLPRGTDDATAISMPAWRDVVEAARRAVTVLERTSG